MTVMNHYEEYVKEAIGAGADFIVSGAGLPVNLAKYAAGTRAAILPIVSSARALKLIVKQWQRADRLPGKLCDSQRMPGDGSLSE